MNRSVLFAPDLGFYCQYCDRYFYPNLDRSEVPISWKGQHDSEGKPDCPFTGKFFEISIEELYPTAREIGQ